MLAWLCRTPGVGTGSDEAKYLLLASSLRHVSYREIWLADLPFHAQYPPGFPAWLAVLGVLLPRFDWLLAANIALSVAALLLAWHAVRRRWSDGLALFVLAALAFNPYLVGQAGVLMSEPLFMALSMGALVLLTREDRGARAMAAAGALAIGAALTRSAGTPIIGAVLVLWLLQRRWKPAGAMAVASALCVGLWLAWTVYMAGHAAESYVTGAIGAVRDSDASGSGFFGHLSSRIADYFGVMIPMALGMPGIAGTLVDNVVTAAVSSLGLVAGLIVLWRRWRVASLYIAGSIGLLLLWPWTDTRFITPLLPVLVPCVLAGVAALAGARHGAAGTIGAAALALILAINGAGHTALLVERGLRCTRGSSPPDATCVTVDQASFYAAARYIAGHLPRGAVVASAKPAPLFYYSGHPSVRPIILFGGNDDDHLQGVREGGAEWVLLGSLMLREVGLLHHRLSVACDRLALEAAFPPRTYLFRIVDGVTSDSTACRTLDAYRRANWGRNLAIDR